MMRYGLGGVSALLMGWWLAPLYLLYMGGDCNVRSTFIYDEPDRVVITHANWYSYAGSRQLFYQATITLVPDHAPAETILSNRNVNLSWQPQFRGFLLHTDEAFRIAGPQTSDAKWGRYIDPIAEQGFSSPFFLFSGAASGMMAGYKGIPLTLCMKK